MQNEKDVGEDALLQLHIEAEAGYRKRKTSGLQEDLFIEQPQVQPQRRPQSVPVQQQVKAIYSLLSPQTQDLTLSLFWRVCIAEAHTHKAALFPKARKTAHFSNLAFTNIRERKQGKLSIVLCIGQGKWLQFENVLKSCVTLLDAYRRLKSHFYGNAMASIKMPILNTEKQATSHRRPLCFKMWN